MKIETLEEARWFAESDFGQLDEDFVAVADRLMRAGCEQSVKKLGISPFNSIRRSVRSGAHLIDTTRGLEYFVDHMGRISAVQISA